MTREKNFTSSLRTGLAIYSGWNAVSDDLAPGKFPPTIFPAFVIIAGDTRIRRRGYDGAITAGEQDFTVRIYFTERQLKTLDALGKHSDLTDIASLYITSIYTPPLMAPGETYRIERAVINKIDAPILDKNKTRFIADVSGTYSFTQF
jgi:hypothetical protein